MLSSYVITNDFDMTPQEIAFCYKKRWDIEVYFKFLKQNLNFSHFLSTNENGIKVILYMTIITSMLVMIYKKENELGFSIAKFNFYLEMQEWVGALLVVINGGDLSKTPFRHVAL
ncbi:transposase [Segatella sinensis]|uniref:Transposase n=1 Tax=Segatella sinensis TaxID=3085167 RepID=A0ABV1G1T0_9BACT